MRPDELEARIRRGEWGRWSGLVGADWPRVLRVLHPARSATPAAVQRVPWSQLPGSAGVDLSRAAWHEVSGVRLHTGRTSAGWTDEPVVGPDESVVAVLVPLLAAGEQALWLGWWQGWDGPRGAAHDAALPEVLRAPARVYDVVRVPPAELLAEVTAWARSGSSSGRDPLPDLVWGESGAWISVADVDLPCTVVGCDAATAAALQARPDLEVLEVDPRGPVVA